MPHPIDTDTALWRGWFEAAANATIDSSIRKLYDDLQSQIAARSPTCWLSGRCCHFDSYGHRLYVTGLEIAWLIRQLDDAARARLHGAPLPGMDGCPFQVEGRCSVHAIRPLGCRVYFCDPSAQQWQNPLYEQFLAALRNLHEAHAVDYRYMEWRAGLESARRAVDCIA